LSQPEAAERLARILTRLVKNEAVIPAAEPSARGVKRKSQAMMRWKRISLIGSSSIAKGMYQWMVQFISPKQNCGSRWTQISRPQKDGYFQPYSETYWLGVLRLCH